MESKPIDQCIYSAENAGKSVEFVNLGGRSNESVNMYFYMDKDGITAVRYARNVIMEKFDIHNNKSIEFSNIFEKKSGVFITLNTYPEKELRGCIGYPTPVMKLKEAIKESALNAAFGDPRFPPLERNELKKIIVEVSILTPPEEIDPSNDPVKQIKIGRDGLIITEEFYRGLLLPQVAVEYNWTTEEFLNQTCIKAGLCRDSWRDKHCKIEKFSAEIFYEIEPEGNVIRKVMDGV